MRRWYPLALAALAWLGLTTAAGAQAARDGFVADYRCVVVRILLDVHGSGDRARGGKVGGHGVAGGAHGRLRAACSPWRHPAPRRRAGRRRDRL